MINSKCSKEDDHRLEPERMLVLAVINSALVDLLKKKRDVAYADPQVEQRQRRNQFRAYEWLFQDEGNQGFSFRWCCEVLDFHPRIIRDALIQRHRGLLIYLQTTLEGQNAAHYSSNF